MSRYIYYTLDVFTDRIFGGNPLAVFPHAAGLSTEQMQAVAREFNLSETVFVLPAEHPAHFHAGNRVAVRGSPNRRHRPSSGRDR